MDSDRRIFFRNQLRTARAAALADAEGFQGILHSVEMLGQQLAGKGRGLGEYEAAMFGLASKSALATELSGKWPEFHTEFHALYGELRQARNDAMHQGAYARALTDHAVEIAIVLEDALMHGAATVSQFMVRDVIEAKPWHPVSYVRQQMLTHAFSFLPILHHDAWKLVPEYNVAKYLRNISQGTRNQRLALLWQIYSRRDRSQIHFRQYGQRRGGGRAMSSRMAWRTAGRVG